MTREEFKGFSPELFQFLSELSKNNNKNWFDEHRRFYQANVLEPIKAYAAELGPLLHAVNSGLETRPLVGRTISRISNDIRFHKDKPPYRLFVYIAFPQAGQKWSTGAVLFTGIFPHGVTLGFYPGGHRELQTSPIQASIKANLRAFQRYLDERRIPGIYSELGGGDGGPIEKWPLPGSAKKWVNLESFTVGEYFSISDPLVSSGRFLDRARQVMLDLYPLWIFSTSDTPGDDLQGYRKERAVAGGSTTVPEALTQLFPLSSGFVLNFDQQKNPRRLI